MRLEVGKVAGCVSEQEWRFLLESDLNEESVRPFVGVETEIVTIRKECLDRLFFWTFVRRSTDRV